MLKKLRDSELNIIEDYYADCLGNIYSAKGKKGLRPLKLSKRWENGGARNKHRRVKLYGKNHDVHKLIYNTFKGLVPEGHVIRHLDDNADNNTLDNLVTGTPKENGEDAAKNGNMKHGSDHFLAKLDDEKVYEILRLQGAMTQAALGLKYGVAANTISLIYRGKTWKHITLRKEENIS